MRDLIGSKIKSLRDSLGETQAEFGDRFGVEQATVSRWEKGELPARIFEKPIAELAGMSVASFFHSEDPPRLIPIVGKLESGEAFKPADDRPAGGKIEKTLLAIGGEDQVAVPIRGDSMQPVYRNGDILIGKRLGKKDFAKAIGKDCIVKTVAGDGYIKILQAGSKRGTYTLRSYNPAYADIRDVEIEWVAPIAWVRRPN